MALPFVVIVMSANLRGINVEVEQAARSLGANRITTLRRVVFPLALPGMIAGGLFAFLISFDELIIALFISSPTLSTLPKKLWDGLRTEINPTIAAVSTLLVILSVVILLGAGWARKHFEKKTQ
jgi:putative spermidine/putrescine transport system permease protein